MRPGTLWFGTAIFVMRDVQPHRKETYLGLVRLETRRAEYQRRGFCAWEALCVVVSSSTDRLWGRGPPVLVYSDCFDFVPWKPTVFVLKGSCKGLATVRTEI